MRKNKNNKRGLTLVELIIAIGLFSLVITIAVGLFTRAISSQRRGIAIQNAQDNGRYLLGMMSKEIRMSNQILTPNGWTDEIELNHPTHGDVTYSFDNNKILRNGEVINAEEVVVDGDFHIQGSGGGDDQQPRVSLIMNVSTTGQKQEEATVINLQTTLSLRKLE